MDSKAPDLNKHLNEELKKLQQHTTGDLKDVRKEYLEEMKKRKLGKAAPVNEKWNAKELKRKSMLQKLHETCNNSTAEALNDPKVMYLLTELEDMGCKLPVISCIGCVDNRNRKYDHNAGYRPLKNDILLCQDLLGIENKLASNYKTYRGALMHELVHAFDQCRIKGGIDYNNPEQVACTEIRASSLSGECNLIEEMGRWRLNGYYGHYQDCVKRRATLSLKTAFPDLDDSDAVIESVWDSCYKDKEPFRYYPYREL